MIRNVLHTLGSLRAALAVSLGIPFLIASSAYAQEPTPAPAAPTEATTERVIVTGSYIPTAETESALPVTVYTAEVLKKQGANTPIEGLRQLPSFVGNTITENDSNGGNGQAFINLRALGFQNTLTLINGRRAFNFADINAIPIGALSRTEVLKDGASAIYGSDAVAGVVNFILLNGPGEKPYEGAELFALYGNTTEKDAHVRQVYLRGGVTGLDGKVSIAAEGEYYSRANLFSRDREIATTGDLSNNPTGMGWGGINNNSPTYSGRVSVASSRSIGGVIVFNPNPFGERTLRNLGMGGTILPSDYRQFDAAGAGTDPDRFNFREFTPAIPAVEKAMYFVTGRYKIFGDGLQIYGDIMYSHTKQDNGLAAAPFAVGGQNSPYNSQGAFLNNVRYRTVQDLGLRKSFFDSFFHRFVIGLNGDFNIKDNSFISRFGYDTGFLYEDFEQKRIDSGDAQFTPLDAEIAAGNFNPFIGVSAPLQGTAATFTVDPVTGQAVPTGMVQAYDNLAAAQRASYIGHSVFKEHDYLYDIKINMHLFPNMYNGGIDLAAGYEHRNLHQQSIPDPVQAAGDQLGFNQAPNTKTTQEVDSYFTELNFPIVTSTMNVPFVRSFEIAIAWRYEKFAMRDNFTKLQASFDNVNEDEDFAGTPRVSLRYQPIADLTLRASWGQSFRSPTPSSLFDPVSQNFPVLFDPVVGVTLQPPEGVWQGGNTALLPEKTDAYTAGLVYTPKWLPGFTMTMDWYQIFTTDLILSPANFAQVLLSTNVEDPDGFGNGSGTIDGPGGPADGVTRFDNGTLAAVDADFGNAGKRLVQGLDVTAVYEIPTERWGKFTFSGGWNHFFTWKAQADPTAGYHNFLGDYNNGTFPLAPGAIPFNKAFLRGEWEWHNFDFVSTVNYIGDFEDDPNFIRTFDGVVFQDTDPRGTDPVNTANPSFVLHRRVTSYITLDLQLAYEFVKPADEPAPYVKESKDSKNVMQTEAATASIWQRMLWGTRLTVGVNNVFDRQPPSVLGAFNDNYDTSLYSIRNRYYYVSLTKKF
jgi:iron complex outermembrane receptor protein